MLRQRRFRGIFLHPRTRGAVPAPLRHEGKGPRGHHRLVLRLLQHPTSAQLGRVATTRRLREDRDHPTGGRIKEASTFSGEAQSSPVNTGVSWHAEIVDTTWAWHRVLAMQTKLHCWATAGPGRRFDDVFNLV